MMTKMESNFFQIEALGDGDAKLTINLQPYLDALNSGINVNGIYQIYAQEVTGINSHTLPEKLLNAAIAGNPELEPFLGTLLHEILRENACELIKNSMDEVLFRCLDAPSVPAIVEIIVHIEHDQQFKVSIRDSGAGFPSTFLENFDSDERLFNFLNNRQSHRQTEQHQQLESLRASPSELSSESGETTDESSLSSRSASPDAFDLSPRLSPLNVNGFGGRGIAIRNLVTRILTGLPIQTLCNEVLSKGLDFFISKKCEGANISLSNQGGACIEMTMPDTLKKTDFFIPQSLFFRCHDLPDVVFQPVPAKFGRKKE